MMTSFLIALALAATSDPLTLPIDTPYAQKWLQPQAPLRIYGDTYFVGSLGMSNVLIRTDAGLVLIDGALPQSVAMIEANIRQLGFRVDDIKYILNTEAHFDHSGGIAALARDSGAVVLTSPAGVQALRAGRVLDSDPQKGEIADFPAVANVRAVGDGEMLRVGATVITAHFTPGHTPGSTTWSWSTCEQGQCRDVVFSSSLSAVSGDHFHFSDGAAYLDGFRASIARIGKLPCDILITAHPEHSGMDAKLKAPPAERNFVDANACRNYAAKYTQLLDARLAKEKAAAAK